MRWQLTAITMVAALGSAAHADELTIDAQFPPAIRFDDSVVSNLAITRGERTLLTFDLSRPSRGRRRDFALDLPAGARVTEVIAGGVHATPIAVHAAFHALEDAVTPVLATWDGSTSGEDHLTVRVARAKLVTLAVEFPATRIVIDTKRPVRIDGVLAKAFTPYPTAAPAASSLDESTAVFVDLEPRPVIVLDPPRASQCSFGAAHGVRATIKRHRGELQHCFELVAQRDRIAGGVAVLHFRIEPSGTVSGVAVDAETALADAPRCIADHVAQWEFTAEQQPIQVNYPVTFTLGR